LIAEIFIFHWMSPVYSICWKTVKS